METLNKYIDFWNDLSVNKSGKFMRPNDCLV